MVELDGSLVGSEEQLISQGQPAPEDGPQPGGRQTPPPGGSEGDVIDGEVRDA